MVIPNDDFIGHQLPTSFAFVGASDLTWMERLWYTAHPIPGGAVILNLGCGYHPNRNIFDAHAGITIGSQQHNLRLSRHLGDNPLSLEIGPLRIQVLEGLRRHRLTLQPNESGLSFDIEFLSSLNPHEEARASSRHNLRLVHDLARYQQSGRYSGWIKFRDKSFELSPESWWGQRDHSWGLRHERRTDASHPPVTEMSPGLFMWFVAQFDDCAIHLFLREAKPGVWHTLSGEMVFHQSRPRDAGWAIKAIEHDLRWAEDPNGQTLKGGNIHLSFANGETRTLEAAPLAGRYFLKAGMYGGYRGWIHGADKGPFFSESDDWDLSDAETRREARQLGDHVTQYRMGSQTGYGIMEYGVHKGYPKYLEVQDFPGV